MSDIKYMDIDEFRSGGYLHEVNRRLLHPLGLALEVMSSNPVDLREAMQAVFDSADVELNATEVSRLLDALMEWFEKGRLTNGWVSGVWDYRDDPEGMVMGELDHGKMTNVRREWNSRKPKRMEILGFMVQDRTVTAEEMERINGV